MRNWQLLRENPRKWQVFKTRELLINTVRQFFRDRGYLEAEVPLLAPALPAESHLDVFETRLLDRQRRSRRAFLTTSPEVFLKKLLVAGSGNCFTITKSFRNSETNSATHNPEFTILEWYRTESSYADLMDETEELFKTVFKTVCPGQYSLNYQGKTVDIVSAWERLSMVQAFQEFAGIDLEKNLSLPEIQKTARLKGYSTTSSNWEQIFHQIYLNEVEPKLGRRRPTIIYDFPAVMAALAKHKDKDNRFAERFEFYIAGLEMGDCYTELTDAAEQENRFQEELAFIKAAGKTVYPYDADFIQALKTGLPECAGMAIGLDRVAMLFTDSADIRDVLLFPASEMWPEQSKA